MKISACFIAKNEEKNISTSLESIKSLASEIVLVDTGSTDNTVQEALKYGAKIYHYKWQNDFSKARNYALSKAKGDWIIFLDADEYFTKESIKTIPDVIFEAENGNYDMIFSLLVNYDKYSKTYMNTFPAVRIFKNNRNVKYVGAIHEMVSVKGRPTRRLDATKFIKIIHTGYSSITIGEKEKGKRNLDILLAQEKEKVNDSNLCFYISEAYSIQGELSKALEYAFKVIKYNNGNLIGIYQKNYLNILSMLVSLRYPIEDIKHITKKAIASFPDFPDFHFFLGDFYRQEGRLSDAIEEYEAGLVNIDKGLNYQSRAPFTINEAMIFLAELYYKNRQFQNCTKNYIEILKSDLYEYGTLKNLLFLFSKFEKNEDIYSFMSKLYDYKNIKDLLFLLKSSLQANNSSLAERYFNDLDKEMQEANKKERALIKLLNGDYIGAVDEYKKIYNETYNGADAISYVISSVMADDVRTLMEISQIVNPSIKRIVAKILKNKIAFLPSDKKDLLNFFKEIIKIGKIDLLTDYIEWISELDILYEVAEISLHYEHYNFACQLYKKYMDESVYLSVGKMCDVYLKMGNCMRTTGQYEEALQFYDQARNINPRDYRVYEIPIIICQLLNDSTRLKIIVQQGVSVFPDSSFLNSVLKV